MCLLSLPTGLEGSSKQLTPEKRSNLCTVHSYIVSSRLTRVESCNQSNNPTRLVRILRRWPARAAARGKDFQYIFTYTDLYMYFPRLNSAKVLSKYPNVKSEYFLTLFSHKTAFPSEVFTLLCVLSSHHTSCAAASVQVVVVVFVLWELFIVVSTMIKLKMSPRKRHRRSRSAGSPLSAAAACSPPTSPPLWEADVSALPSNDNTNNDFMSIEPMGKNTEKDKLADNIAALLQQEESNSYAVVDYLNMTVCQNNMHQLMGRTPSPDSSRIDEYCREQICEWSYRVCDYFRVE